MSISVFSHWKSKKYLDKFQDLADLAAIWISEMFEDSDHPHMEKNKLFLNEYLGIFRPCF